MTTILTRLSAQLHQLEVSSQQVEDAIAHTLENLPGGVGAGKPSLQKIDHIVQALHDLQIFLSEVSNVLPDQITVDVSELLKKIRLRDVSEFLGQNKIEDVDAGSRVDAGEVHLF